MNGSNQGPRGIHQTLGHHTHAPAPDALHGEGRLGPPPGTGRTFEVVGYKSGRTMTCASTASLSARPLVVQEQEGKPPDGGERRARGVGV
eukprot:scaffold3384_cov27-Tisochrysis_lutea.AAC.1